MSVAVGLAPLDRVDVLVNNAGGGFNAEITLTGLNSISDVQANDIMEQAADAMLDELLRAEATLSPRRA